MSRWSVISGLVCVWLVGCGLDPGADDSGGANATAPCEGVAYGEVCFQVVALADGGGSEPGRGVVHAFQGDARPAVIGTVDDQLYIARFEGDTVRTTTTPIDVHASSTISIGDFAGDGQVRIALRDHEVDSVHVVDEAGQIGVATLLSLDAPNYGSPAAAMDLKDGSSVLLSRAGIDGMMRPYRLEGEAWVPQGPPVSAPDFLAWSFDANGDGLRDVGLSSSPALLQPDDAAPGVRVHVLISDGLGGFEQHEHEFHVPCGVSQFYFGELTGDERLDLGCYYETSEWQEAKAEPKALAVYVAPGFGDGRFGPLDEVLLSIGTNARALRGFANLDGQGLPELLVTDEGQPARTRVVPPPWADEVVEFDFAIRLLDAADINGDGIHDLVVHNRDGAHALLSG